MKKTKLKEPIQWKPVPMSYRKCMASGRHSFALYSGEVIKSQVVAWYMCWLCNTHRL